MSPQRPLKTLGTLAGFLALFVVSGGVGGMAYFHFGDPRRTCVSCHEMADVHSAWTTSSHSSIHCRRCHGGSLTLDLHALHEHVNRVVQHFSRTPDRPIQLSERDLLTVQDACKNCHPQSFADWKKSRHSVTYTQIFLDPEHNKTEQLASDCLRCHGMFFEGRIEDLVMPLSTTGPWALKDPAKACQPAIPCMACHQMHTPAAGFKSAKLYGRHDHLYFSADLLPCANITQADRLVRVSSDASERLCTQCHAPNAFRQVGSGDDHTPVGVHEGLSCLDCHSSHSNSAKGSCAACHPADSHCGLDVEKMDTTYLSAVSKHNIHSVSCGDCHNGVRPGGNTTAALLKKF